MGTRIKCLFQEHVTPTRSGIN